MRTAGYTGILLVEAAMIALIGFLQTASANDQRDSDQIRPATLEDHWYRTGIDYIDGDYSQGVATDGKYWYFTHKEKLFKTTYDFELVAVNELAIPQFLLDRAYDHVGDIDYFEGKIYAPLEDEIRKNAVVCLRYYQFELYRRVLRIKSGRSDPWALDCRGSANPLFLHIGI